MRHPISIVMQFICYAGCIAMSGIFAFSYKVDPPRAITLAVVFFILAFVVLIKSWRDADADAAEKIRINKLKKLLGQ